MRRSLWIAGAVAGLLTACALFTDLSGFDGTAPPPADEGGGPDTGVPPVVDAGDATTAEDVVDSGGPDACADADISTDPEHCGACNRSCLGGTCAFGKCAAVPIITGLNAMAGLVIANGKIYVGVSGAIRRYELDGTGGLDVASTAGPAYLAADATYLYFTDLSDNKVKRWPLAGGAVEDLVLEAGAFGIAISPSHLYFTRYAADGGVERIPIDGGARELVFTSYGYPEDVDFANGELVVGGDGVNEVAVFTDAGFGAKRVLSSFGGPCSVAAFDGWVYFGEQQTGKIYRVTLAGGNKEELASGARVPVGVWVNDKAVYWRNYDGGAVMRLAR